MRERENKSPRRQACFNSNFLGAKELGHSHTHCMYKFSISGQGTRAPAHRDSSLFTRERVKTNVANQISPQNEIGLASALFSICAKFKSHCLFYFGFVYSFLRKSETGSEQGRGRERDTHSIRSGLRALSRRQRDDAGLEPTSREIVIRAQVGRSTAEPPRRPSLSLFS